MSTITPGYSGSKIRLLFVVAVLFMLLISCSKADRLERESESLFGQQHFDMALDIINEAIALDPQAPSKHLLRSDILTHLDSSQAALESILIAIDLDSKDPSLYDAKGSLLSSMDQYDNARESHRRSL